MAEGRRRVASRHVAVAAFGGLSTALGGAPHEAPLVALLGPGLLLAALVVGDATRRQAAALGFAFGMSANLATTSFVVELLEQHAFLPSPVGTIAGVLAALGLAGVQALPWVLASWVSASWPARTSLREAVFAAAVVLSAGVTPMIFPWRLANSQTAFVPFVQWLDVSGSSLVDFFQAFIAGSVVLGVVRREPRRVAVGLITLVLVLAGGELRAFQVREVSASAPVVRIGVVQPDVSIESRRDALSVGRHHRELMRRSRLLEVEHVDWLSWPESSFPFALDHAMERGDEVDHALEGLGTPLLFGATSVDGERVFNSVVALDGRGRFAGIADKAYRMIFGEFVPGRAWVPEGLRSSIPRGLEAAPLPGIIDVDGRRIGILNCYEDLITEAARSLAGRGVMLLSNHTNDAWFEPTFAPRLHAFLARLRAIETRRELVRTTNTGQSMLVRATGEVAATLPTREAAQGVFEAHLLTGESPYVAYGDWFSWVAALVLVVARTKRR